MKKKKDRKSQLAILLKIHNKYLSTVKLTCAADAESSSWYAVWAAAAASVATAAEGRAAAAWSVSSLAVAERRSRPWPQPIPCCRC